MKWKLVEPPAVAPAATARTRDLAWLASASIAAAVGAAAMQTTIAGRDAGGTVEFLVVGASIPVMTLWGLAAALLVVAGHFACLRIQPGGHPASTRSLRRLAWCAVPVLGVAAAMAGGRFAPPLVYAFWETAPVWIGVAVGFTVVECAHTFVTVSPAPRLMTAVAIVVLVAWVLAGNVSLRRWIGPVGDEPRYLRHAESWYQGNGADISRLARMADAPLHEPPRVARSFGLAVLALFQDARDLAVDTAGWLSRPGFVWNRARNGDGAFLVGRHGGVYQTYQPGLSLLIFPGYAIDRWLAASTVFDGQFPARLYGVYATLLAIAAAAMPFLASLCRRAGAAMPAAIALSALSLAALPMSSLALQIYPETAACLAIAGSLALVVTPGLSRGRATLAGAMGGYLVFLHARFLLVAVVLLGFGVWRLRGARAAWFALAWSGAALLQIWYVYHATGLPWPTAFYEASGIRPLGAGAIAVNLVRFAFDRDWGVVPHVPLVLLAAAGWIPLWRARRDLAVAIALVVVSLAVTASAHTVSAAGGTPDRLIAASVPLFAVPAAAAAGAWHERPIVRVLFVLLVSLSLLQAWDYNRAHVKEVGPMVVAGVSGWRINLLFPYLSEGLTRQALPALAASGAAVLALAIALARRARPGPARFGAVRAVAATALGIVVFVTSAGAWDGSHPRYRADDSHNRAALVGAYVRARTCALCWSSMTGPIGPGAFGGNRIDRLTLDVEPGAGARRQFRVAASGPDGPVFGVVRFDFGDGQVSQPTVMAGALGVAHEFRDAGAHTVKAWLERAGAGPDVVTVRVEAAR